MRSMKFSELLFLKKQPSLVSIQNLSFLSQQDFKELIYKQLFAKIRFLTNCQNPKIENTKIKYLCISKRHGSTCRDHV